MTSCCDKIIPCNRRNLPPTSMFFAFLLPVCYYIAAVAVLLVVLIRRLSLSAYALLMRASYSIKRSDAAKD